MQSTVKNPQGGPLQHLVQVLLKTKTILQLEILFLTCVKHHPATQREISGWQTSVSIQVNRLKQVKNRPGKMVQQNFFFWRFNKKKYPMLTSSSGKCWYFPQKRLPRFLKHVRLHFCQWQGGLWKIFYNFSQNWENVNSLGDDWLCEVQKLLEINFLVDVTVKVEISTSCNTISRIFLKCHTLKLILKNINKQASLNEGPSFSSDSLFALL